MIIDLTVYSKATWMIIITSSYKDHLNQEHRTANRQEQRQQYSKETHKELQNDTKRMPGYKPPRTTTWAWETRPIPVAAPRTKQQVHPAGAPTEGLVTMVVEQTAY